MTRFTLIAAFVLILAGCSVGPRYRPPVTQAPSVYKQSPAQFKESETDVWKVAEPSDAMLRGNWWEIFNDPELNALEEQLNIDNQNIKQFFENFMQARATGPRSSLPILSDRIGHTLIQPVSFVRRGEQLRFIASGHLLGARPLGQGAKHRARVSSRCAVERCRSRECTANRAGQPGPILFRNPGTGCTPENSERDCGSGQDGARVDAGELPDRRR